MRGTTRVTGESSQMAMEELHHNEEMQGTDENQNDALKQLQQYEETIEQLKAYVRELISSVENKFEELRSLSLTLERSPEEEEGSLMKVLKPEYSFGNENRSDKFLQNEQRDVDSELDVKSENNQGKCLTPQSSNHFCSESTFKSHPDQNDIPLSTSLLDKSPTNFSTSTSDFPPAASSSSTTPSPATELSATLSPDSSEVHNSLISISSFSSSASDFSSTLLSPPPTSSIPHHSQEQSLSVSPDPDTITISTISKSSVSPSTTERSPLSPLSSTTASSRRGLSTTLSSDSGETSKLCISNSCSSHTTSNFTNMQSSLSPTTSVSYLIKDQSPITSPDSGSIFNVQIPSPSSSSSDPEHPPITIESPHPQPSPKPPSIRSPSNDTSPDSVTILEKKLFTAARENKPIIIRRLLEAGVNVNSRDKYLHTPLHCAVCRDHIDVVSLLLDRGANVNSKDTAGNTPLHFAAGCYNSRCVKRLVTAGAEVNCKNNDGETPLHSAVQCNNEEVIRSLLGAGATKTDEDNFGRTPLDIAQGHFSGICVDHEANATICKILYS